MNLEKKDEQAIDDEVTQFLEFVAKMIAKRHIAESEGKLLPNNDNSQGSKPSQGDE